YIVTGFAESPVFHPGVSDPASAQQVAVTGPGVTNVVILSMPPNSLPAASQSAGTLIQGKILPDALRTTMEADLVLRSEPQASPVTSILPHRPDRQVTSAA